MPLFQPGVSAPKSRSDPAFSLFQLALYGSLLTYVAILAAQNNQALSQAKVWSLFRWAWLLAPAGGLAAAWGWRGLERRAWQGHPAFYPLLLTASHLACAMAVLLPPWPNDPAWPLHTLALALALYGAALLALRLPSLGSGSRVLEGVSVAGGPLAAVAVLAGFGGLSSLNPVQAAAVAAAGALLAWRVLRPGAPDRIPWNAADWVVLAVLLWWLLPWGPLPDLHHEGFYLGPVNDLLHGRAVLVGTSCQYGVGVVYGLAAIFTLLHLLPSFEGLWCLDALLFLAVYLAAYPFLRRLLHSRLLAVLAILVAAVAERFDPVLNVDNAAYPSVGPLRFGLPLLLLLAAWHRRQGGEPGLRPRLAEGLVLAVAGLWSLETLVYTLAGYGAFCAGEAWLDHPQPRRAAAALGRHLAFIAGAIAAAHAICLVGTRALAGAWPDWSLYWDFLSLYSGGFGSLEFPLRSPWLLLQGISLASLLACSFLMIHRRDRSAGLLAILGLTAASIAEFTYFIGRSHPANLGHLAFPSAVLSFYWLDRLARSKAVPRAAAIGLLLAGGGAAATVVMASQAGRRGAIVAAMAWTRPGGVFRTVSDLAVRLRHPRAYSPVAAEAATLAGMYLPGHDRIVMLIADQSTLEAHLLAGTCDLAQISDPNEDALVSRRRLNPHVDDALAEGDIIVAGPFDRPLELEPPGSVMASMQDLRLGRLRQRFAFQALAHGPLGVYAVRLAPLRRP